MSADGGPVARRLMAAAADEPVLALFVLLLLVMAVSFLIIGLVTFF